MIINQQIVKKQALNRLFAIFFVTGRFIMELKELRESVRRNMVKNDLRVLDILATGHNLIKCIESQNWERLGKKTAGFIGSYNALIEDLNKKETPTEDEIIELEARIEALKGS